MHGIFQNSHDSSTLDLLNEAPCKLNPLSINRDYRLLASSLLKGQFDKTASTELSPTATKSEKQLCLSLLARFTMFNIKDSLLILS